MQSTCADVVRAAYLRKSHINRVLQICTEQMFIDYPDRALTWLRNPNLWMGLMAGRRLPAAEAEQEIPVAAAKQLLLVLGEGAKRYSPLAPEQGRKQVPRLLAATYCYRSQVCKS